MKETIAATALALLAYVGLALLISTDQTLVFMCGFLVGLHVVTCVYSAILLSPRRPDKRKAALGVSGVVTMLAGYPVMWFYWGSGDGPFSPYNGLFGSRITVYCLPNSPVCYQISSWLVFSALVIASLMILWELRPRGKPTNALSAKSKAPSPSTDS